MHLGFSSLAPFAQFQYMPRCKISVLWWNRRWAKKLRTRMKLIFWF